MSKFYFAAFLKPVYFLFFSIVVTPVFSQNMELDVSFGNGGKVLSRIRNYNSYCNDIVTQSDGKLIAAGSLNRSPFNESYLLLVRYNTDGSIDSTFGLQGSATKNIGVNSNYITSIALQTDGKIVAGGSIQLPYRSDTHFAIVRFNSNGTVDSSFGNDGLVTTVFKAGPDEHEELMKVIVKQSGKILAGGYSYNAFSAGSPHNVVLAQFNEDGSIDSSFGTNGKTISSTSTRSSLGFTMVLDEDDKIVAGGPHNNFGFGIMKFNSNGSLDSTFGRNGFGDSVLSFSPSKVLIQPDKKVVFVGRTLTNRYLIEIVRYNPIGSLDNTFGVNGKVISSISSSYDDATGVHIDINAKLWVTGYVDLDNQSKNANFSILRFLSNGNLDSTFAQKGILMTDFSNRDDVSHSSVMQPDGKIILAGRSASETHVYDIALARYTLSVLPLKLLTIIAKKDGKTNVIQWTTAQEINVSRFEIERSVNGRAYYSIGNVNAGLSSYSFTDNKPFAAVNFYRLKMIDKDGKFEHSPVRTVVNNRIFYVTVFPLPVKDRLNVQIQSNRAQKATASITDLSGKTILSRSLALVEGINNSSINVQALSKGVYLLKVITSETSETRKIIVE